MTNRFIDLKTKEQEFLGRGIAFPFQLTAVNQLCLATGEEDVEQAIRVVLGTSPGERLMRPEFGCRIYELVFAPYDASTEGLIIRYVEEALARWEPRIEVQQIEIEPPTAEGQLQVRIAYTIKAIHSQRSIVYPFYLSSGEV